MSWTPSEPGTHVLSARLVLVLFPGGGTVAGVPINWDPPGDSMFATAPIWSTTIDLEHTIEVTR